MSDHTQDPTLQDPSLADGEVPEDADLKPVDKPDGKPDNKPDDKPDDKPAKGA